MPQTPKSSVPPVAIIVSRYNQTITNHLREGAVRAYLAAGGREADLAIIEAAGTFELPVLVQEAALAEVFHAVVALGCVIKGETDHDRYLAEAVSKALLDVALETGVPVSLGVLTVNSVDQGVARSGGPDGTGECNKGQEAMQAALASVHAIKALNRVGASGRPVGVRFALPAAPDKAAPARKKKTAKKTGRSKGAASRSGSKG